MAEHYEIVCDAASLPLAEALSLLLHAGASPAPHALTLLPAGEAAAFLASAGLAPPRLPVLYDNLHSLALTLPLAAVAHAARGGGAAPPPGAAASDAARGDALAEVAVGWLGAPSGSAGEGARRCALLGGLLARYTRAPAEGAGALAITHGDLLAWLCLEAEVGKWGAGAALEGASPVLGAFLAATGRRRGVAAFVAAREARRSGGGGGGGGGGGKGGCSGSGSGDGSGAAAAPAPAPAPSPAPSSAPPTPPGHATAVTGASGFLASWIVKTLLELGRTVHGTVRSLQEPAAWGHLLDLPGAGGSEGLGAALAECAARGGPLVSGRLRLFPADLLGGAAPFQAALAGCHTLIHTASPYDVSASKEALLAEDCPALAGTAAVLQAAEASPALRRVVLTSSAAAVYVGRGPSDHVYSGADWSDAGLLEAGANWYALGKLRAERAAWDFVLSARHVAARAALPAPPLTMAAMCPTQCLGPLLSPRMNQSSAFLAEYASGAKKTLPAKGKCLVDVRDVAMAHVLAGHGGGGRPRLALDGSGRQAAPERYLLVAGSLPWRAIADVLRGALPKGQPIPTQLDSAAPSTPQALCSQLAAHSLGVRFRPMETSIAEAAQSYVEWGLLAVPGAGARTVLGREEVAGALGGGAAAAQAAEALLRAAGAAAAASSAAPAVTAYATPAMAPGGEGCAAGGRLAEEPFPLAAALCALAPGAPAALPAPLEAALRHLRELCLGAAAAVRADWLGVYAVVPPASGAHAHVYGASAAAPNLLKLAYTGAPSRAYFPLTPQFAEGSNNSLVGLSAAVVHICDVAALGSEVPYYSCDGKVRSEVCLPILGEGGRVVGIVDAEAFAPHAFDQAALQLLYEVTLRLPALLRGVVPALGE
jgi:nucleoside-diphosphate-sugar epimerase/putative methionine-R-sulfoxide reductase with GAF domain